MLLVIELTVAHWHKSSSVSVPITYVTTGVRNTN